MEKDTLVRELVRFGEDQLQALGKAAGGRYVARCLALWRECYGEAVAVRVRERLARVWKEK
jgi:hypothetical protein